VQPVVEAPAFAIALEALAAAEQALMMPPSKVCILVVICSIWR
jgi:hypothetical protein